MQRNRGTASMMMVSTSPLLFCILSIAALTFSTAPVAEGIIGINYGRLGNNLPTPKEVVTLLKSQGITHTKMFDTDSTILKAFSNSGITLTVNLPNQLLINAASSTTYTTKWLKTNILTHYPSTNITTIAVGNEVISSSSNTTTPYLIPSLTNLYTSLKKLNLHNTIKLSTPIALSALTSSYPPSAGKFNPSLIPNIIKPLLTFLNTTSSPLMINAYPSSAYIANPDTISLPYALSNPSATPITDSGNGLRYTNLFDAQVDAVYAAMEDLGYNDVRIVVTETGWPSNGDVNEVGATKANAAEYNGNLVKRVLGGNSGTPRKVDWKLDVYLFALFNENQKPGPISERNFGLFFPDMTRVYDIPLTLNNNHNGSKVTVVESPTPTPTPTPMSTTTTPPPPPAAAPSGDTAEAPTGNTWCVASGNAGEEKLQAALDYACGEGGADCKPIQNGAGCFNPDTIVAHASYAFNSYYQMKSRGVGTCDFGGTAHLVTQPPQYGNCRFPTGN